MAVIVTLKTSKGKSILNRLVFSVPRSKLKLLGKPMPNNASPVIIPPADTLTTSPLEERIVISLGPNIVSL